MNDNDSTTPTGPGPDEAGRHNGTPHDQSASQDHKATEGQGLPAGQGAPQRNHTHGEWQGTTLNSQQGTPHGEQAVPRAEDSRTADASAPGAGFDAAQLPPKPDLPHAWSAPAPAYAQPTAQQHAPYGAGAPNAFGIPQQPPAFDQQPPYPGGTGDHEGSPHGAHRAPGAPEKPVKRKKTGTRMLVAGLVIGALVGGASGAGTFSIIDSAQQGNEVTNSSPNSSVTINNNKEVTETTAIAAKAAPSVVTIAVRGTQTAGSGSGIVLSKDGYILTNNHVVTLDGESSHPDIQVTDDAGNIYTAKVVGTDPVYDLAVIKLEGASDMTPMTFGDSSNVNVGDAAVAIGAPLGLSGTVTDGIISALNRSITVASSAVPEDPDNGSDKDAPFEFGQPDEKKGSSNGGYVSLAVIQTDAAINPGNSGGALVDDNGELIGVNVAIASAGSSSEEGSQSGSIGVGFAIPANIAKRIADEIIENGTATHGLLGAAVTSAVSDPNAKVAGALIKDITGGGAADEAGLRAGDVVTKYGDITISNDTDLVAQVKASAAGSDVVITYVRNGKTYTADVTLGKLAE
ncbi:S1C family serine protease [Microbacterium sp. MPKO10]|uniref:S1C family serine protease n=1 Tax=Microbacterium sp. MPKO10 TaxID=2989818 RepID=UPI002236515D|nr:trypsin-like peptidase domain-containing protein [Microbacterium sp. MPKO10]MCW4458119.1 trypsin-like peptidase domain-containing protein [Microbacterium sp. MPKO10]